MRQCSLVVLFLLSSITVAFAQGYRGRDFWICFPENALTGPGKVLQLSVYIAAEARAKGMIETVIPAIHKGAGEDPRVPFSVEAGASTSIDLDTLLEIQGSGMVERKSVHITSDQDISVYVVSHRPASTDSYMAIPTPLLGKNYVVVGYSSVFSSGTGVGFSTQCDIVAAEDTTLVTAHLTAATVDGLPAGRTLSLVLNRGWALQIQSSLKLGEKHDLTGTTVTSSKPIAFVTGHRCAQVPADVSYCDMLMEMEPPVHDWGKDYILTKFEGKDYYVFRVVANTDSTEVLLNGSHVAMLRAGEFYEKNQMYDAVIHTSKPSLVAQYATSSDADTVKVGDPFMLLAIPNDRFITETTTTSVVTGGFNHYLNIVVPDSGYATLELDGAFVGLGRPTNGSHPVASRKVEASPRADQSCAYSVLTYSVLPGRHLVKCEAPVAVYAYGFGINANNYDSYGHACGQRLDK